MKDQEDILRKKQDEVANTRNKLQGVTKKEGTNYLTRDFTDEIYDNQVNEKYFVSHADYDSSMFADVLVVLQEGKRNDFISAADTMMEDYYTKQDEAERKRFPDQVKVLTAEIIALSDDKIEEHREKVREYVAHAKIDGV